MIWILILIVVVALMTGLPLHDAINDRGQYEKGAKNNHGNPPSAVGAPENKYPTEEQHRAAESYQWAHQRRINRIVATFSAIAAAAAFYAAVIARDAFYETKRQADEAKRQADEARRQANAAEVQIAVAKDTEETQLRAYLFVRPKGLNPPNFQSENPIVKFLFEIISSGATPASDVLNIAVAHDFPYPLPDPFDLPLDYVTNDIRFALSETAPPEKTGLDPVDLVLDQQKLAEFTNHKRLAFVYGNLSYVDAFDQRWSVNYCFFYDWEGISRTGNAKICPWQNERKRDQARSINPAEIPKLIRERPKAVRVAPFKIKGMEVSLVKPTAQ